MALNFLRNRDKVRAGDEIRDREVTRDREVVRDRDAAADRAEDIRFDERERLGGREYAVVDEELRHRQYGGFHWGSAFFGWLVSSGMATLLLALLAAAGTVLALTKVSTASLSLDTAATVGLAGGILFCVVLGLSYYAGGYVAGRMARFDGARQGVGVWLFGLLTTLLLGAAAALLGAKYNILGQLNLPRLAVNGDTFSLGGQLTMLATFVVTLLGALLGGIAGTGYHRRVDAAGRMDRKMFSVHRHAHSH